MGTSTLPASDPNVTFRIPPGCHKMSYDSGTRLGK
jgi:hypothetical protein